MGGFGDIFSDIFGEIFGGGRGARSTVFRGADLRYNLEITLEQAAHGFDTKIRIPGMSVCDTCKGSGAKPGTHPSTCPSCRGAGEPGVNGGPPGDLYVQVHIKPHPVFQRDHDDLHCEMPISITTAALGGEIEIPTLDGSARIRVPAETQSGKTFRLKAKGIKGVRSQAPGDLFCHVVVETPVNLTERQRQILR